MKKLLMIIPLVFLLCFTFSCQRSEEVAEEPVVDVEADIAAIKGVTDLFDIAANANDADGIVALYIDNAVRIPPPDPALIGKEAIRDDFQEFWDQFTEVVDNVVVDVKVSGNLAFSRGTWTNTITPKAGGESTTHNGNWVSIQQKQPDGSWKIICDIWSNEQLVRPWIEE